MTKRDRIETVLRVRRVEERQAAADLARAAAVVHDAEAQLGAVRSRYEAGTVLDLVDDLVPARLRDRTIRTAQAEAIQRGRERVRDAVSTMTAKREILLARSQATRAMERLDERLAIEEEAEARRAEVRELDERATTAAGLRARNS